MLAVAICAPVHAQRPAFASYGSESGLTNLNVTVMLEDPTGVVWLGTQSGVFRANGVHFERQPGFDAAGLSFVLAMHLDHAGRLWVMSNRSLGYRDASGVHKVPGPDYDALNDQNIAFASSPDDADALLVAKGGKLIRIASKDGGRTWQAGPALGRTMVERHPEVREITTIATGSDGHLWAGCGRALCEFSDGLSTVRPWGEREGLPPDHWASLLSTRGGAVWARGEHSVAMLGRDAERFRKVEPLPKGLFLNVQTPGMVEDPDGRVLLNLSKGVAREEGGVWRIINAGNGLPRDEVDALFFDHQGLLWLAPSGHGVAHWLGYGDWESWTPAEGMSSETVWGIARARTPDAAVWLATERGLDRLEPQTGAVKIAPARLDLRRVRSVAVDRRGHVWSGDALGRLRDYDPRSGSVRTLGNYGRVTQLLIDTRQRVWFTSLQGIGSMDPADGWKTPHLVTQVPAVPSADMAESGDGTLWFSTGLGLYRLQGEQWQKIGLSGKIAFDNNFALAAAPDGTLWIESREEQPVVHLKVVQNMAVEIGSVSSALIGSSNITFLDFDQRGWLWVGSDAGVSVFNGRRWIQCTKEDGLLWDDTDSYAYMADEDGSIWIGTSGGLAHLRHPETLFSERVPGVRLEEVHLGSAALPAAGGTPKYDLRRPVLSAKLLSTDYGRPTAIVYRYRLSGLENEWQETTSAQLRFPALPPGSYTLSVVAYDRRLHLSSAVKTVSFELVPPWWQRTWFRVVERLGLILALVLVWRGSLKIMVARQQELEAQVQDRTRELEAEKAELLLARANLLEMNRRDGLTGLMNRSAIFEKLAEECNKAISTGDPLAVIMADLDRFKHINDTYGHVVGDTVIRQCADRLRVTTRPGDSVGRYGGEELLILMPGLNRSSAAVRLEELRIAIASEPICHGSVTLWMTCSFGVAWLGSSPCELEVLVEAADAALYRAKQRGRNRFEFAVADAGECSTELLRQ